MANTQNLVGVLFNKILDYISTSLDLGIKNFHNSRLWVSKNDYDYQISISCSLMLNSKISELAHSSILNKCLFFPK